MNLTNHPLWVRHRVPSVPRPITVPGKVSEYHLCRLIFVTIFKNCVSFKFGSIWAMTVDQVYDDHSKHIIK